MHVKFHGGPLSFTYRVQFSRITRHALYVSECETHRWEIVRAASAPKPAPSSSSTARHVVSVLPRLPPTWVSFFQSFASLCVWVITSSKRRCYAPKSRSFSGQAYCRRSQTLRRQASIILSISQRIQKLFRHVITINFCPFSYFNDLRRTVTITYHCTCTHTCTGWQAQGATFRKLLTYQLGAIYITDFTIGTTKGTYFLTVSPSRWHIIVMDAARPPRRADTYY